MECTCIEDKYEIINGVEVPYNNLPTKNVVIGKNKTKCQYCVNNENILNKEMLKQSLLVQISEIEKKIYYSELDGDIEWVAKKKADRLLLKQQLLNL